MIGFRVSMRLRSEWERRKAIAGVTLLKARWTDQTREETSMEGSMDKISVRWVMCCQCSRKIGWREVGSMNEGAL